jgi:uncharacterized membrane protein
MRLWRQRFRRRVLLLVLLVALLLLRQQLRNHQWLLQLQRRRCAR